jgi:hypothetical protein
MASDWPPKDSKFDFFELVRVNDFEHDNEGGIVVGMSYGHGSNLSSGLFAVWIFKLMEVRSFKEISLTSTGAKISKDAYHTLHAMGVIKSKSDLCR